MYVCVCKCASVRACVRVVCVRVLCVCEWCVRGELCVRAVCMRAVCVARCVSACMLGLPGKSGQDVSPVFWRARHASTA